MEAVSALLAFCEKNPPVTDGLPSQRVSNTGFDVFFDLSLNKRLNKPPSHWWFETPECSLWHHSNGSYTLSKTLHPETSSWRHGMKMVCAFPAFVKGIHRLEINVGLRCSPWWQPAQAIEPTVKLPVIQGAWISCDVTHEICRLYLYKISGEGFMKDI